MKLPKCHDRRKCFAKKRGGCQILMSTYPEEVLCPFCKPIETAATVPQRRKRKA